MKKILFLTGTRADFGKLKSLIRKTEESDSLEAHIFVTGMHLSRVHGMTALEVEKAGFKSIYKYINQSPNDTMDIVLAKTISGLSDYVQELQPDMVVVHGDRVEALAGATVGALNNILVSHVEGGEVSGTIDELIRHSVSKMSHVHFVANQFAKKRLIQLGESESSIHVIGSPDIDVMCSKDLPKLTDVKKHYNIDFEDYSVFMYHPVTTEVEKVKTNIKNSIDALIDSDDNYVVIYPNNDHGSQYIIEEIKRLEGNERFKVFPSIRFEYFLTLLKNCQLMIGNSSAGIREVPFYGIPSINLGSRQNNRSNAESILNVIEDRDEIIKQIKIHKARKFEPHLEFGEGKSDMLFLDCLLSTKTWDTNKQKTFNDIDGA
ncbi:UDP-N-acetylglucosamine 2-epimerase [Vibrio comitans]|uniref:UDP-N-acetyl glucosamine 2-epimerase n=1 Tax=Vibrio comitans NBRC 102076 TaxID=1219078 RepID=A0A4Y3ISF5_9VIBR|nr:UDP-N-acetylglucosamine 2-epimerase [Vibrio comitans]GEA61975.1 UDP-N-acetyl glucosamine 2-epimerase [Vibrio comitans NBRC 102076]